MTFLALIEEGKEELVMGRVSHGVTLYDHPSPNFGLTNMFFRAHRYGPDYAGLQGKDLDPTRYETWNRLYCPEAYSPLTNRRAWVPK